MGGARMAKGAGTLCAFALAPRTLVFCDKISCSWVRGCPRTRASKKGAPLSLKISYFTAIGSPSVRTVADSYTLAAYRNKPL